MASLFSQARLGRRAAPRPPTVAVPASSGSEPRASTRTRPAARTAEEAPLRRGFALEQQALALHPPAVAREPAVVAHDAVAGYGHRDRVRRARARHRAHGPRGADARGDLRVGRGHAGGDLPKRLPPALLETGAAHVQRQGEAERGRPSQNGPPPPQPPPVP